MDDLQEAFYDLIESIKVGHLCRFYDTTLQCSGEQHNTRAPASPAVNHICSVFMVVGISGHPIATLNTVQLGFCVLARHVSPEGPTIPGGLGLLTLHSHCEQRNQQVIRTFLLPIELANKGKIQPADWAF